MHTRSGKPESGSPKLWSSIQISPWRESLLILYVLIQSALTPQIDNPSGKSPLTEDMDLDSVTDIAELSVRDDKSDEEGGYDDHGSREDQDDFKDDDTDDRSDYKSDEGDGYATDEGILGLRR